MSWRAVLLWWLAFSCVGVALIALPDSGPRLVTFSQAHGPGLIDSLGIALLLFGNAFIYGYLWRRRTEFTPFNPWLAFLTGLGTGLLLASVVSDFAAWWAIGVTLLVAVQAFLFVRARLAD